MLGTIKKFSYLAASVAMAASISAPALACYPEEIKVESSNEAEIYSEVKSIANTGKNEINGCCDQDQNKGCHSKCKKHQKCNKCHKDKDECECSKIVTKSAEANALAITEANKNQAKIKTGYHAPKVTVENRDSAYVENSVLSVANTGKNKISGKGTIYTDTAKAVGESSTVVNANIVEIGE